MAFPVHSVVTRTVDSDAGYGSAWIEPDGDVVAGSHGTWRLTYEAGSRGIAVGGSLRVRTDSDTDWGVPQFLDPAAPDYMTVTTPDDVHASIQVGGPKSLVVQIHGRRLEPGERITLTLGDTGGGSPGSRAQTFLEARHDFLFEVDIEGDGNAALLADPPHVSIVGGPAERLVLIAPSSVVVGQPFRLIVKAEDRWGNPSSSFTGVVELSGNGIGFPSRTIRFEPDSKSLPMERGVQSVEGLTATTAGILHVAAVVRDADLVARSNPIVATESAGEYQLHWADPHGGQIGSSAKIADFFRYARDVAGVQFVGYQRNADVISKDDWTVQQRAERELHEPGRFIPIPGFEWSGRTPEGGHHNVYFRRHDQPVRRNPPTEAPQSIEPETELPHVRDLYDAYRNTDTIITPHVGGEHSNLTWHEPTLEPAMEITSSHGSFEWAIREILERGYQLGFLGGSDCYTGRPGDDRPGHQLRRYAKSGLTAIYTQDITLEGFFEAMRARRVYATTGARIVLHVEAGGHWLGSGYTTSDPPRLTVKVIGTAPLESVELFRGLERVYSFPFDHQPVTDRVRILWAGASRMSSYSGIVWDGSLAVDGASISSVESLRFDSPRSFYSLPGDEAVTWHAWGCGYPMGLTLGLNGADDAGLRLAVASQTITGPMYGGHGEAGGPRRISFAPADHVSLSVGLRDLQKGPLELPLGVLDRRLTVSLDHEPGPETAEFEFTDDEVQPGVNPYWVRVVQSDLEMAWSSPLFVDFVAR
jgi:Protein of unknown function (DUF3604)